MSLFVLIGLVLIAFVVGAVLKDWATQKSFIVVDYLKTSIKECRWYWSIRSPWYIEYQQALSQVDTLDRTIRAMDDARDSLRKAISLELVPKISEQEREIVSLKEINTELRQQMKSVTYNRDLFQHERDRLQGENRIAQAKIMTLEGDVEFLRKRVAHFANLVTRFAPIIMPKKTNRLKNQKKR